MTQAADTYEQATRDARLQKIIDHFEPPHVDSLTRPKPGGIKRFVAVGTYHGGRAHWLEYGDKIDGLLSDDGVGYPDHIIDLDTGDEHGIRVKPSTYVHAAAAWDHGLDTASSASRQHFIDTGRYLTLAERAEDLLDSLDEDTYQKVTEQAERDHGVGATALSEEHPHECIVLIEAVTGGRVTS